MFIFYNEFLIAKTDFKFLEAIMFGLPFYLRI